MARGIKPLRDPSTFSEALFLEAKSLMSSGKAGKITEAHLRHVATRDAALASVMDRARDEVWAKMPLTYKHLMASIRGTGKALKENFDDVYRVIGELEQRNKALEQRVLELEARGALTHAGE